MSIVELILAFALVAMIMTPMIALLYSVLPENIILSLGLLPNHEEANKKWYDKSILLNTYTQSHGFIDQKAQIQNTCNLSSINMSNFKKNIDSIFATPVDSLPIDIGTSNTPTGISKLGDKFVVSLNSSSTTDPDLLMSDFSSEWSTIDTGPGLVDMHIDGFDAYVANTSIHSHAQALDLSANVSSVLKNYTFSNSSSSTTPIAKKVLKYKNLLIVGTEKSLLPEVVVFDVSSGKILADIDTNYGINNLYIKDGLLFVLSPLDPEIEVYSLEPIVTPLQKVGEYDAPNASGNARSLDFVGDNIFFTRSKGGEELSVLSIKNNPNANTASTSIEMSKVFGYKVGASVDTVIGDLDYVIAFTSDPARSAMLFEVDKKDLMGNPTSFKFFKSLSLPARVAGFVCKDNTIYLALKSAISPLFMIKTN